MKHDNRNKKNSKIILSGILAAIFVQIYFFDNISIIIYLSK
jgi:hypothetical protein